MSYVEGTVSNTGLFSRQNGCVVCQDGSPSCPSCDEGQECQVSVPLDCTQCPQAYCAASSSPVSGSPSKSSSKASAGAIAGAVIGGLALVAVVGVVTYFVWKHCVKNKRAQMEQAAWDDDGEYGGQREKDFNNTRDARQSGQTRNSIASTVLTRASNIIQIAYIPGVTNRATPTSPTLLVPPVPPIPISVSSPSGTPTAGGDQHFFVPGDLRDSMASGMTGYTDRTSYARNSYAPRSSVASTIYGKAGVVVTPAQTGMRAKAAMVSVKSTGSGSSGEIAVPPVPVVDKRRFQDQDQLSPTGSTFSVGSTFLNNATTNANTATAVRAQMVRVGSNLKQATSASDRDTTEQIIERSPVPTTPVTTPVTISPPRDEHNSPFRDPPTERERRESTQTLGAVMEESKRRSSHAPSTTRTVSPFGDEHATS